MVREKTRIGGKEDGKWLRMVGFLLAFGYKR
jgi:hypothetical protein